MNIRSKYKTKHSGIKRRNYIQLERFGIKQRNQVYIINIRDETFHSHVKHRNCTSVELTRQEITDSGLDPDQGNSHLSQPRAALRNRLASRIRPQYKTLSFICGDFNFCMEAEYRRCLSTTATRAGKDAAEARRLERAQPPDGRAPTGWRSRTRTCADVPAAGPPALGRLRPGARTALPAADVRADRITPTTTTADRQRG